MNALRQQTALNYPDTWKSSAIDTFERLASMGKVTQFDIDEIEERLALFRGVARLLCDHRRQGSYGG